MYTPNLLNLLIHEVIFSVIGLERALVPYTQSCQLAVLQQDRTGPQQEYLKNSLPEKNVLAPPNQKLDGRSKLRKFCLVKVVKDRRLTMARLCIGR